VDDGNDVAALDRALAALRPVAGGVVARVDRVQERLKLGLKARGILPSATVRSPLRDLSAEAEQEIVLALKTAELI
jgi:4-hydroxy-tetrahydrodipicolinate synthase